MLETVSPLLVTLLAAIGATASAGMVQPMFVLLSGTVAKVVQSVLLPGVMGAGVLYIVGALAGREQVTHLANTIKSFVKWAMGGITTVFLGAMALGGMSAGGVDSISFRTMKYTLDKSLPLVGGVVAGSLDSVRGCTILIKNAAGMAGVVMALGVVLMPLLQLMGMSLAFQLTGALCAQVSDSRDAEDAHRHGGYMQVYVCMRRLGGPDVRVNNGAGGGVGQRRIESMGWLYGIVLKVSAAAILRCILGFLLPAGALQKSAAGGWT